MARYGKKSYGGFGPYVSVGEKKAKAKKKLAQMRKKNPNIAPVVIEGRTISNTWWGKAWCTNLESYSDYSNRIGRGRSYVRQGSVLDLQITEGKITALVSGSGSKPYSCEISIKSLKPKLWDTIKELSDNKFESIPQLLAGNFPKELQQVFSAKGEGLFPTPQEISFDCSCPDWASMCKHVAAVLYGIGNRLDQKPELLFTLRGVDINELIDYAIESHKTSLIDKALNVKSDRVMKLKNGPLGKLFDIDLN